MKMQCLHFYHHPEMFALGKKMIFIICALTKQGALFSNREFDLNLLSQFVFHPQMSHYIIIPLFKQMLKNILIGQ